MSANSKSCVVCQNELCVKKKPVVENPHISIIESLLEKGKKKRVGYGENTYQNVVDQLSSLSKNELVHVRYHRICRMTLMNSQHIVRLGKRSSEAGTSGSQVQPPKRGRPVLSTPKRSLRKTVPKPKEVKCLFHSLCRWPKEQLHRVYTDQRGKHLLFIKEHTNNDAVRVALSGLQDPGDASALEVCYHSNCLREAYRTCPSSPSDGRNLVIDITDMQLIMFVKSELMSLGGHLDMITVYSKYKEMLHTNGIEGVSAKQGKYLKALIKKHIPEVTFVQPPHRNTSEILIMPDTLGAAVHDTLAHDTDTDAASVMAVSHMLRKELLAFRGRWKFGSSATYEKPPLLSSFLLHLLFGKHALSSSSEIRHLHIQKTVELLGQVLLQNIVSDRQVQHKPKGEKAFTHDTETPLSVSLQLALHQKVRDKSLVSLLSQVYLGSSYEKILNIEKRIESAVVTRMQETGGFCLPDFLKKGVPLAWAIDNIDFTEDTPFGQNTFHGAVLVVYQEDEEAEPLNKPIEIPDKLTASQINIMSLPEPVIRLKTPKFEEYEFGKNFALLKDYEHDDHV